LAITTFDSQFQLLSLSCDSPTPSARLHLQTPGHQKVALCLVYLYIFCYFFSNFTLILLLQYRIVYAHCKRPPGPYVADK